MIIKLNQKQKDELWWMVISCDYDYSRICIAEHLLDDDVFGLWLEDKQDFKNSLDECQVVTITRKQFAAFIKAENFNSYEKEILDKKGFPKKTRIEIAEAINWYDEEASPVEQLMVRETLLKNILTTLIESELNAAA